MYKYILCILLAIVIAGSVSLVSAESTTTGHAAEYRYHMARAEFLEGIGSRTGDDHYLIKAVYHATMAANHLKMVEILSSQNLSLDQPTKNVLKAED